MPSLDCFDTRVRRSDPSYMAAMMSPPFLASRSSPVQVTVDLMPSNVSLSRACETKRILDGPSVLYAHEDALFQLASQ